MSRSSALAAPRRLPPTRAPGKPPRRVAESGPGACPVGRVAHGWPGFRGGAEIRYPAGEDDQPGLTAVWMRTVPLLPDEEMTPFQRISPRADCGNAFGRNGTDTNGYDVVYAGQGSDNCFTVASTDTVLDPNAIST